MGSLLPNALAAMPLQHADRERSWGSVGQVLISRNVVERAVLGKSGAVVRARSGETGV